MKCVLFCRVSSKEQEDTGYSLPSQEKLLKSYADKHSFIASKIFSISESANGKKQRETFDEMMNYVQENNIKIIICEKVDRLTRNFKDAVTIDEWLEKDEEREVHLVKDSLILHKNSRSQEKLNWGIRILFAKNYIDNLSEEVKKGYKEKVEQGWMPHTPPIGYKTVGDKGHKIHIIDEIKAPFIKKMFELYGTGNYSIETLGKAIYKIGLTSKSNRELSHSKNHEILTNPFYCGKFKWGNQIHQGKQEPIISKELFNRVQDLLNGRHTQKQSKRNFLYQGVIKCLECGGSITWELHKSIIYGHCTHFKPCSQKTWVKNYQIDNQILKAINKLKIKNHKIAYWIYKALKESHKDEIEFRASQVTELNRRLQLIQNRLDIVYEDKLDGKVSSEFYDTKSKQYTIEKESILASLDNLSKTNTKYYEQGVNLFELAQKSSDCYKKGNNKQKREFIRLVFSSLKLKGNKLFYFYTKPFELLSQAVKTTNCSKVLNNPKISDKIIELSKNTKNKDKIEVLSQLNPLLGG